MTNKISSMRALRRLAAVAAAAFLVLSGCSPKNENEANNAADVTLTPDQLKHVRIFTVRPVSFHKSIDTTGSVDFDNDQSTVVIAPFGGPVTQLLVKLGDKVTRGQALATVDSSDFAAAIGTYRKAIVTATNARRVADLDKDLLAHSGVSAKEEEQAQTDAASAEADREAARLALVSLNVSPRIIHDVVEGKPTGRIASEIRSPIAGTVVDKPISPGQLLTAGTTPCFTVADLSRVWVTAQVFGSDLSSVSVGDSAEIETGNGTATVPGKVDNISAIVDSDTRSVGVRVAVDNPGDLLKKQMYVRVRIEDRAESKGLTAPVSAILRDDENLPFVYVVQRDGSFARRHVSLGYRTGDDYEIPTGLKAGERLITDGAIFVQFLQNQ
jgi:cobalt-zinc-cadmium efflux system membrane fusion protein